MIFVIGTHEQFDGSKPFFHGWAHSMEMEGMARKALSESNPVDALGVYKMFCERLGTDHPASRFWLGIERCSLSHWEPIDPWIGFLERGFLEPHVFGPDRVPWIWDESAYVILNGSRLYGLEDSESDWDTTILSDTLPVRYSFLCPSTRAFHEKNIAVFAMQGCRHALELLMAPNDCVINKAQREEFVTAIRSHVVQHMTRESVLDWHRGYVKICMPVIEGNADRHDRNVAKWAMEAGWPYKFGYFVLIDALIAKHFFKTGNYDLREPFTDPEIRKLVVRCKDGRMTLDEWRSVYGSIDVEGEANKCSST